MKLKVTHTHKTMTVQNLTSPFSINKTIKIDAVKNGIILKSEHTWGSFSDSS